MATITGFHHTAIQAAEFDRTVQFYTDVLGFKTKITWGDRPKRAIMLDAGAGDYLEIFERDPITAGDAPILHFALRTDDCAAMLETVRAAGAEVTMETTPVMIESNIGQVPVRIAFFKGPSGEIVELFENALL